MNAVNLIPSDARKRRANVSTSRPTMALIGGLVAVLVAGILYAAAVNNVTTRNSELAQVTASAESWKAAANSYASFVQAAQQRTQQLADVRQLATTRYQWSQLLSQIGGLMPTRAALTTLQATTSPGTVASAVPVPAVQLTGCAASQATVAQTMDQLHRVQGVSAVSLSSASSGGASAGAGASSAAPSGGSGCGFPVQFQVSLTFGSSSAAAAATVSAAAAAPSTAAATTASASAPATSTTGAAQ
jgi:Tfp pilus assembly protein PilN